MPMLVFARAAMSRSDAPSTPCARKTRRAAFTTRSRMSPLGRAMATPTFGRMRAVPSTTTDNPLRQFLVEAQGRDGKERHEDAEHPKRLGGQLGERAPFEHDAAHDAEKMRERQPERHVARGGRHPFPRE